jgi:aminoglycoside phosphotransferase (APT) family kinase protein
MRMRSLPFIFLGAPDSLLEVAVFLTLEMTERHIERVHGYTIKELEHVLLDVCEIFDDTISLEYNTLGGWSNINIRGQSNDLDFVLKLPCSISPLDGNLYNQLFDISLHFNKLGIAARPLAKGQLSDTNATPFIIFEYIDGIIHDSLTDFSDHEALLLKDCLDLILIQKIPHLRRYKSPSDHVTSWFSLVENHVGLADVSQEVGTLIDKMKKMSPDILSFVDSLGVWTPTLMHGDLWIPNIVFQTGKVILLDFEDSAYGNHLYDLAFLLETPNAVSEKTPSGIIRSDEMEEVNDLRVVAVSYIVNWSLDRLLSMESGLVEPNLSSEESRSAIIGYTRGKISRLKALL